MMEHRLIEKMLVLADQQAAAMNEESFDPVFVDTVVDFIKTYADRTHHGKEENILFADLGEKRLNATDARIMKELIDEHRQAREKVAKIVELNERYKRGEHESVGEIRGIIAWLASFYPVHIKKEDDRFFPDTEKYFDERELDAMLARFWEFDKGMIHEKYRKLFDSLNA
jgi:hemerythrin-like domain-containing protein